MKNILYLFLVIFLIFSCSINQKVSGQQGISGKVIWLEGNLMPSIGDSANNKIQARGIPIQRTILIYKAVKRSDTESGVSPSFYSIVKSKLIRKIKTDKTGSFKANLDPGKYSIFVQEEDGLFANVYDGEGFINPVTVENGKFTGIVIKVNYKAAY